MFGALLLVTAVPGLAQTPGSRGRLVVTVVDQTGRVLPTAKVRVTGQDAETSATAVEPAASAADVATFESLGFGRYTIQAEFPGFETVIVRNVRVRGIETRTRVMLPLKKLVEKVTVGQGGRTSGLDPRGDAFSTVLTREQIAALPDDPDEMEAVLKAMAPPGAIIRVDGFTGGKLPPKSQIRSIRLPRMDQFAAQNHG
ncbi:MAG: carboxypeptidase-like regulatory domain-containing protein, partial [Pseudomonadota bacterium]